MKLSIATLSILAASVNAADETPCSESAGVCVCSGSCPSFITDDWSTSSSSVNGVEVCVASKEGENTLNQDGDSATAIVDAGTYTTPFTACPGEGGDTSTSAGAGLISLGYYAGVIAAFVGIL